MSAAATRYESLDAIRGVGVMGILVMNIVAFALPFSAYSNPAAGGPPGTADLAAWFVNFVAVDSKMRGLFSMLFGASTLLVIERAEASGRSPVRAHYARMIWLALFGLVHFYFIWFGDILFLYAACGMLLFPFRRLSVKALGWWAAGFFLVGTALFLALWSSFVAAQAGTLPGDAGAGMRTALDQIEAAMGANSSSYAKDVALYLGSYGSIVAYRTTEAAGEPVQGLIMMLWESMGLMLAGMALFKARMLTGEWPAARYLKWAIVCFLIAGPPLVGLAVYQMHAGFDGVAVFGGTAALSVPFDIIMTFGWVALILWLIRTAASDAVRARLAAAGRMAFTNYLTTSIVMTTIFYGYGLGLFGSVSRAALYLFCFGMWAAMLLWSKPWLDRFHYGPLEWLWRSLARAKLQPMRRRAPAQ
jgi:uncharacterized protein